MSQPIRGRAAILFFWSVVIKHKLVAEDVDFLLIVRFRQIPFSGLISAIILSFFRSEKNYLTIFCLIWRKLLRSFARRTKAVWGQINISITLSVVRLSVRLSRFAFACATCVSRNISFIDYRRPTWTPDDRMAFGLYQNVTKIVGRLSGNHRAIIIGRFTDATPPPPPENYGQPF